MIDNDQAKKLRMLIRRNVEAEKELAIFNALSSAKGQNSPTEYNIKNNAAQISHIKLNKFIDELNGVLI